MLYLKVLELYEDLLLLLVLLLCFFILASMPVLLMSNSVDVSQQRFAGLLFGFPFFMIFASRLSSIIYLHSP